jgi:hypothetical protein
MQTLMCHRCAAAAAHSDPSNNLGTVSQRTSRILLILSPQDNPAVEPSAPI